MPRVADVAAAYPQAERPLRLCDLPERQRPREMFDRFGADRLPDEALLAILLGAGVPGLNVLDLSRQMLNRYNGRFSDLARATVEDLTAFRGIGAVKAKVLKAALEIARRLSQEQGEDRPAITTPESVARLLREEARVAPREVFWILPLDARNRLRRDPVRVSEGIVDASLVHPREVFHPAIQSLSSAVVVAHNHPSGDVTPSAEDVKVTRQLVDAGRIVGIRVLDHVILGRAQEGRAADFLSLRESGLVEFG
jgi:DNA repair protein RadC